MAVKRTLWRLLIFWCLVSSVYVYQATRIKYRTDNIEYRLLAEKPGIVYWNDVNGEAATPVFRGRIRFAPMVVSDSLIIARNGCYVWCELNGKMEPQTKMRIVGCKP